MKSPEQLYSFLLKCWAADTAYQKEIEDLFDPTNPTKNQCVVTALIVQDEFGGQIVRVTVNTKISHYYNVGDFGEIDLTRSQFPYWIVKLSPKEVSRKQLLRKNSSVEKRYQILRDRLDELI